MTPQNKHKKEEIQDMKIEGFYGFDFSFHFSNNKNIKLIEKERKIHLEGDVDMLEPLTRDFFNALKDNFQREFNKRYSEGFKEGKMRAYEEMKHEQRKLLDGFGHPKDCEFCSLSKEEDEQIP